MHMRTMGAGMKDKKFTLEGLDRASWGKRCQRLKYFKQELKCLLWYLIGSLQYSSHISHYSQHSSPPYSYWTSLLTIYFANPLLILSPIPLLIWHALLCTPYWEKQNPSHCLMNSGLRSFMTPGPALIQSQALL